jgi:tripartite-type tricarboxylate transporter receptor subunit TctC
MGMMRAKRITVVVAGFIAATLMFGAVAWGQNFPSRPVKVIIPYPAGGSADTDRKSVV